MSWVWKAWTWRSVRRRAAPVSWARMAATTGSWARIAARRTVSEVKSSRSVPAWIAVTEV